MTSVAIATAMVCAHASASVIYDNQAGGAAGITAGSLSEAGQSISFAEDFILARDVRVRHIEWTGYYTNGTGAGPDTDDFTITIYEDAGNAPGAALGVFAIGNDVSRADSGFELFQRFDVYTYSAAIDFQARAGQRYWVSLLNAGFPDTRPETWAWGRSDASASDTYAIRVGAGAWQTPTGLVHDFRLVPAPAGVALLAGGLALAPRRRR